MTYSNGFGGNLRHKLSYNIQDFNDLCILLPDVKHLQASGAILEKNP